ncbi:hypothetical protein niasHT_022188 [Heterodera trifolii]|uniref:Uncharacterized protein n=1 Tax=Heterodera trifolii TaxID=157864 RepID=A0ABD2JVQ1_9BILA
MAAISALLLLLPMLLNVQKIPDECIRSDIGAVNSAISALIPWKSPAEIMAQLSSQLSTAQAALVVKMNWESLETNQNGLEAKAPEQFDLALFVEALEATVEMDDGGKEVKLRRDKLNEWATKTGGKAEKEGDKAEKEGGKAEKEGDKVEEVRDKAEKEGDKAEKEGDKTEEVRDKAEKEGGKSEKGEDKAEKEGDKVEAVRDKTEKERNKAEEKAPKGEKVTETFTKAEENGDKEEKKDPGGREVRMEFTRRKDENGNEEVVVTFVKNMKENDGPAKGEEMEKEEEEEMSKEKMVPKLDMGKVIGANSAVPIEPKLGMMTNSSSTSNTGANMAKPVDMPNDTDAKPAVPMVPQLDMVTSGANLAKPVVPKLDIANDTSAKPSMPIMIPDIFWHSQGGKLPAEEEAAHERRKMLKKSLYNILLGRHKRETVGIENEAENVASAEDKQQQIIVSIEKLTTLAMMSDGLAFLTKVINLEIVVANGGKGQRPEAVPPSDATAPNWMVERDGTENGRANLLVDQNGTENGGAEMEMESHESPKNLPIENSDGNWEKKAAIKAYLEHGIANANGHKKWERLAMAWYSELLYWTAKWIEALKNRMAEAKPELASTFIFSNTGLAAFEELKNELTKCVTKMIKLRKWIGNSDKK